jgi:hypothetical protein
MYTIMPYEYVVKCYNSLLKSLSNSKEKSSRREAASHSVTESPAFYWAQQFIPLFIKAYDRSLSWP